MEATEEQEARRALFRRVQVRRFGTEWPDALRGAHEIGRHFAVQLHARFAASKAVPMAFWVFVQRDPISKAPGRHVYIVEPTADAPEDVATKDVLAAAVRMMCVEGASAMVVTTSEAWTRRLVGPDADERAAECNRVGLGNDPEAQEVAWLCVETSRGAFTWFAPIHRPCDAPPYLGPFTLETAQEVEGRFAGFLRARA